MAAAAAPTEARPIWLFRPWVDLLLGCGVGNALVFVALAAAGSEMRSLVPLAFGPLLLLVSGTPHYGATLLRAYERRDDRRAYALFTVWMTAVVLTLVVAALFWPIVGSLMLTVMLTWSPWHYSGQNYGIALMYLGRAGVPVTPRVKKTIYASFVFSFALTVLAIHGAEPSAQYAPTGFGGSVFSFLPIGIPGPIRSAGFVIFGLLYAGTTIAVLVALLRAAQPRRIAPAVLLLATQALWFVVPTLARQYALFQDRLPLNVQDSAYAMLWVAAAHSIQYLWISLYYAHRRDPTLARLPYLAKCLLAGASVWTIPALLLAPGRLGRVPYDLGLAVLISSAVNLHHFLLDGAIWKLRDGRVARVLMRTRESASEANEPTPRRLPVSLAPLVWAAGVISVVVIAGTTLESELEFHPAVAAGDTTRASRAYERLVWMGQDSPNLVAQLASAQARGGDLAGASREVERALALYPTPDAWRAKGYVAQLRGETAQAIAAYEQALRLRPGWPEASNDLAWMRATSPDPWLRDGVQAVRLAEGAARATGYTEPGILDTLAASYAAAMRFDKAVQIGQRAAELARAQADPALAGEIDARVDGYRAGRPHLLAGDAR